MPDTNGVLGGASRVSATGQLYLSFIVVANDIPPTNARTPRDINGVMNAIYDSATNSIRVTVV